MKRKYHQTVDLEKHDELSTKFEEGTFSSLLTLVMLGGGKIFIYALKEIESGEELFYDYSLFIDQKITKAIKNAHKCECGSKNCRKTMLFKN